MRTISIKQAKWRIETMIKQETIIVNGRTLIKTYSDSNKYIVQNETGVKYSEAVDVPNRYTYTESNEDIEIEKTEEIEDNLNNLL